MTSLPDRPDLHQLRIQAKELKRALSEGESEALDRVLASHPKYAGRPAERADGQVFTLRDAQATIARELGFDSWKALLEKLDVRSTRRWNPRSDNQFIARAGHQATKLKHGYVGVDHLVLALLDPPQPGLASDVLGGLGLTHDDELERAKKSNRRSRKQHRTLNPAMLQLLGMSQGIAIGLGSTELSDEHVLLAMLYSDHDRISSVVDPDEVLAALQGRGFFTPVAWPPVPATPTGPWGPFVYLSWDDLSIVTRELAMRFPLGTPTWGMNKSKWKQDHYYIQGEDEIPLEEIVRAVLPESSEIEVLTNKEGAELEKAAAPRRYRPRPNEENVAPKGRRSS
jgi:hypothetical protein